MAKISDNDKKYLLSLTPDDLTFELLVELFGNTVDSSKTKENATVRKSRFNTNDEFTLLPNEYLAEVKTDTTVGRFIYNKYIIERLGLGNITGYVNWVLTDSGNGRLEAILSKALLEDKISVETFGKYIDYRDTLGMQLNSVITTSFTLNTLRTPPAITKRRNELFKQYDKELSEGNIAVSEKIEKELVGDAKEILKGDPGMDLYDSEARGNFGNYKNLNIFKGATINKQTGKYDIVRSSFMDGIRKEDIPSFGNGVVAGAYPKAVATQVSGYMAKKLLAAMQTEVLDEKGSDCGTKGTIDITITKKNAKDFHYRYIVLNGKLKELTPDSIEGYIGKTVKLRTPMMCIGDKICNVCAGNLNYLRESPDIGLECSKIATTLTRLNMKKFHIANLKSTQINPDDMLI